ncbi:MAG: mechanosensitive ion channel family protein [Verrucomicrobia bacterium]|nr:mechanosensitive ion channel family protein [Verrucomicrobiota bacterium]
MQRKLEFGYRVCLGLFLCSLGWALWANAQAASATPSPANAPTATNGVPRIPLALDIEKIPPLTFGLDRVAGLQAPLLGKPIWHYAAFGLYLLLALLVSKLIDVLVHARLKSWAARTEIKSDAVLLELLAGPIKVIVFVILLEFGLDMFSWSPVVNTYVSKGLTLVVAASITYMVLKCIDFLVVYWKQRAAQGPDAALDDLLFPIVRKCLKAFVVIVAGLVTAEGLGIPMTSAIASLSIGGLAVGLAAQDTLANLFGAVTVFIDKPFRIGDRIKLDGVDGVVETIGLRSTRVRNLEGHLITVPNKMMGGAAITNVTRRPHIKTQINFGIVYDTPPDKIQRAVQVLEEIYRSHPMTHDVSVCLDHFDKSALNLQVVHWWKSTDHAAYLKGLQELNLKIKERFDAEGLRLA